ncbi:NADH dehydrogenase [ubiquinone] 1 beta subcomplex subunit 9 isoform X2 [Physcomitrium patens]|uniref:NADH dehydrogenase [ubiquinone] 1 beta subcomplex subunit 9 isoform X2 n=1 Tax=Physcomitrium patens TaxID=3218 RepID=UPI00024AB7B8|nr:NADH dehydrogenase [ubiquinone] 1 beta subcomplex subunit 9-like isoform X2 [Physcomitrium patens]|eukprot:XP_024377963.1 NADH dehydrogenase [ubiquinone] 1 beta subcomplex subunit 9-like isoform X2 [Physcomitrella patens]
MSTAAVAARRALQQQRTRVLYRKALRNVLSWAVHRDIFYVESNLETIDRLLYEGESRVEKFQHPDPYIVPWAPGGSKYARNPPVPSEIGVVLDFGREENH